MSRGPGLWHWWGQLPVWATALLVAGVVLVTGAAAGLGADFDGDGLTTWQERGLGTDPLDPDSDGDGLADGPEVQLGTQVLGPDSDGDGILDGEELRMGADPRAKDSDGDGIPDPEEADQDCDGDGIPAVASSDDDSDLRPDADEPPAQRCRADSDGDGLLDGEEGNDRCARVLDCDEDGLQDAREVELSYDPLDPDSFGSGFPDAVTYAFQQAGQPPSPDRDDDGIPDGWEDNDGALDWGPFDPTPGRTDLLIEYIRVVGPHSGRYLDLNFTPAYEDVARMFAEQGITVQWVETLHIRDMEQRPDFLSQDDLPYFRSVLDNGTASLNPYVTSVVLNPQQEQSHLGSVLGAAFLRNMIASIDYGAHTSVFFEDQEARQSLEVRPIIESHIVAGQSDLVQIGSFDDFYFRDGLVFLRKDPSVGTPVGYTVSWRPEWFLTPPRVEWDDNATLQLQQVGSVLHTDELASTIAHELGHTLGLCHIHEPECQARYGGVPDFDQRRSTMSYDAGDDALRFLPVEWAFLEDHLGCPPQATAALVAEGAGETAILSAKYDAAFSQAVAQRECQLLASVPLQFLPETERTLYFAPSTPSVTGREGAQALQGFGTAVVLAAIAGAAIVFVSRRN